MWKAGQTGRLTTPRPAENQPGRSTASSVDQPKITGNHRWIGAERLCHRDRRRFEANSPSPPKVRQSRCSYTPARDVLVSWQVRCLRSGEAGEGGLGFGGGVDAEGFEGVDEAAVGEADGVGSSGGGVDAHGVDVERFDVGCEVDRGFQVGEGPVGLGVGVQVREVGEGGEGAVFGVGVVRQDLWHRGLLAPSLRRS